MLSDVGAHKREKGLPPSHCHIDICHTPVGAEACQAFRSTGADSVHRARFNAKIPARSSSHNSVTPTLPLPLCPLSLLSNVDINKYSRTAKQTIGSIGNRPNLPYSSFSSSSYFYSSSPCDASIIITLKSHKRRNKILHCHMFPSGHYFIEVDSPTTRGHNL